MPLRGDYLTIKIQQHSSGTANEVIADTISCNVDFSGEALDTTSQDDALIADFIAGKISATVSGDYLLLESGIQFAQLFAHINAGNSIEFEIWRSSTAIFRGTGIMTSLNLGGGNSDTLTTGAYSMQIAADAGDFYGPELIVNGDFADWTGDDPDSWTVTGEVTTDPMVTEVAGGARMYSTGGIISIRQAVCEASTNYRAVVVIATDTSGGIRLLTSASSTILDITGVGTHEVDFENDGINFNVQRLAGGVDMVIGSVSLKEIL